MKVKRFISLILTIFLIISGLPVNVLANEITETENVTTTKHENEIAKMMQTDIIQHSHQVALGDNHSGAVKKDGSLWMWGFNNDGQLGNGSQDYDPHSIPVKILDNVAQISLGNFHSAAIKRDGTLWMWGNNDKGQLGNNSTIRSSIPIKIMDNVAQVSIWNSTTAALKKDGTLWMWGNVDYFQIGDTSFRESHVPIQIMDDVAQICTNGNNSAVIKKDGTLWMWGSNNFVLGNGVVDSRNTPIKILDDVAQVSLGAAHTAALKKDGTLWMWGWNDSGQLGYDTKRHSYGATPAKIMDDVAQISLGGSHSAVIKKDGTLWMWGWNGSGEIGNGKYSIDYEVYYGKRQCFELNPIQIMENVAQVALGGSHSAAIKKDGTLWLWGRNHRGQLGNNSSERSLVPIKIMDGLDPGNGDSIVEPSSTTYKIRVLEEGSNSPLGGVKIDYSSFIELYTDNNGYAEFDLPESYMVVLSKTGYNNKVLVESDLNKDNVNTIYMRKSSSSEDSETEEDESNPVIKEYITQHKDYFNSNRYKTQIKTSYPYSLGDALDQMNTDPDDITYTLLKRFNDFFKANITDQDLNKIIIARFIFDKDNPSLENSYQSKVNEILNKVTSRAISYLKTTNNALLEDEILKLQSLKEQMRVTDIDSPFFGELENEWITTLDKCAIPLEKAKSFLTDAGLTATVVTSALDASSNSTSKMMELSVYGQAYLDVSEEQIEALKMLGEIAGDPSTYDELNDPYAHVDGENYTKFSKDFPEAVNSFISDMEEYKNSNNKELMVYLEGLKAYEMSLAQSGINFGINLGLSKVKIKGGSLGTAVGVVQDTQTLCELLTNIKESHYNASMVRRLNILNCALAKLTEKAGNELKASAGYSDKTLDKAILFDQTVKMYKNALLFSYSNAAQYYQAINENDIKDIHNSVFKEKTYKKITERLEKQTRLFNDYDCLYECIQCHDKQLDYNDVLINHTYGSNQNLNSYTICCPVTVSIKDNNGNLVATLSDSEVNVVNPKYKNYFSIIELENGEKGKFALVPQNYKVEINGTGQGNMNIAVGKFNSDSSEIKGLQIFKDLSVTSSTEASLNHNESTGLKDLTIDGQTKKGEDLDLNKIENGEPDTPSTSTDSAHIRYQSHIENLGWVDYVKDGTPAGTEGQALRQEAIRIQVVDSNENPYSGLGVTYRSHVQDEGWQNYVSDNSISGTTGLSRKVEAVQIKLTGSKADQYDVWYQTHIEDYGWTNWVKNGEACGSEGFNKRMESIKIQLLPKDSSAPSGSGLKLYSNYGTGLVRYQAHIENVGWQDYVSDGQNAGTTGQNLKLESLIIAPSPELPEGDIQASAHIQDIGWTDYVPSYSIIGTTGQNKRLEAIKLRLTGDLAKEYDIVYQSHVQDEGWQDEVRNDAVSGTTGLSRKIEAINIKLVKKGSSTTPSEPVTVPVTGITLEPHNITLDPIGTYNLTAKIVPENATNKTLTWTSSDLWVVGVDSNGKIFANNPGKAVVTVSSENGIEDTCIVEVVDVTGSKDFKVICNPNEVTLKVGESVSIPFNVEPITVSNVVDVSHTNGVSVDWTDSELTITGVSPGENSASINIQIKGYSDYISGEVKVHVVN